MCSENCHHTRTLLENTAFRIRGGVGTSLTCLCVWNFEGRKQTVSAKEEASEMTRTHQQGSKWEANVQAQSQHTNSRVLPPVPEMLKNVTHAFNEFAFGVRIRLSKVNFVHLFGMNKWQHCLSMTMI